MEGLSNGGLSWRHQDEGLSNGETAVKGLCWRNVANGMSIREKWLIKYERKLEGRLEYWRERKGNECSTK